MRSNLFRLLFLVAGLILHSPVYLAAQEVPAANGKPVKCWEFTSEGGSLGVIGADDGQAYLSSGDGRVLALSQTGALQWSSDVGGSIVSNLISSGENLYVASSQVSKDPESIKSSKLDILSRRSGLTIKTSMIPFGERFYLVEENGVMITVNDKGSIIAFDRALERIWNFTIAGGFDLAPAVFGGGVTLAGNDRSIRQVMFGSGETVLKVDGGSEPSALVRDRDGTIFLGDVKGRLHRLSADDGRERWVFKSGGRIQSLRLNGSKIIATSVDNFVYAISTDRGGVVWKTRLPGRAVGSISLIKDRVLVSVIGQGEIFAIDSSSGRITDRIKVGAENTSDAMVSTFSEDMFVVGFGRSVSGYSFGECAK